MAPHPNFNTAQSRNRVPTLRLLSRRQALALPIAGFAQSRFPGIRYRNYPACLPAYLAAQADAARRKRDGELERLTSETAIRQRQAWARRTLIELIGGLPHRTPLNARTLSSFERERYRVDKVIYESRPGFFVSANLYLPRQEGPPFPGVLFQLGHALNGKAYASYQAACQGLVQLGFAVLAFDPMGQGERIYYPDAGGVNSRLRDADLEHTVPGRQMLLVGATCTQFQLWDAVRSLDYLAAHPSVDARRLASAGQSGGATLTMLLAAVDDRLQCAAEFSGNTENVACNDFLPPGSIDDAEQNLVGSGPAGFDRWDLFYPFAPKPMLVSISDKDSFGTYSPNYVSDSWRQYQHLAGVYRTLGAENNLAWRDTPLPHGLSYDSRLHLYNWLRRNMQNHSEPVRQEPPIALETEEQLRVSGSGNTARSFGGQTPFTLTRSLARETRTPLPLAELLNVGRLPDEQAEVLGRVESSGGVSVEAVDIPSAPLVGLPAWLFRGPKTRPDAPAVLILNPRGRNAAWHEGELCQNLAQRGFAVCAADVRGIGDLAPQVSAGAPGYAAAHQREEDYAWSSLIFGRPLAGQRVTDILAAVRALRHLTGSRRPIAVAALGSLTVPAIFAAALEQSIHSLYLAGGLGSFRSIVEEIDYNHPFANFVPRLLLHTDLPELVEGLSPRTTVISGLLDGRGATMAGETARNQYRRALALGHVTLRETAAWSEEDLAAWLAQPMKV